MTTNEARLAAPAADAVALENLRSGQRMAIISAVMSLAIGYMWGKAMTPIAWMSLVMAAVLMLTGVWKLATGFGYALGVKVVLMLLQFVPIVNLVTLLVLVGRATPRLRQAGYKVGFFGAAARANA